MVFILDVGLHTVYDHFETYGVFFWENGYNEYIAVDNYAFDWNDCTLLFKV